MDFMVSNPRDPTSSSSSSSSSAVILHSTSSSISKSYVEDLIHTLKYLFNEGLITLQVATKEGVDSTTALATLESLMAAISRTTDHSSESIAQTALEDLRQLSLLSRQLQKKLARYNSTGSYLGITSTVAVGVAAFAMPVGLIPVQPLPQLFNTLWKERMINPIVEKIKVVEASRFMIHSMIIKVAQMKDMVQSLVSLVAKREDDAEHHEKKLLVELEKALADSLEHLEMLELELELENIGNLS